MPDVSRSDSQRSDTSASKPRVSFNRDVHVKRIVSRDTPPVSGALSGDGAGHLVALPVHKERLKGRTKKQLAEEAAKVINQADKVDCTTNQDITSPEKFYTLPTRKKHRKSSDSPHSSHERLNTRRRSEELGVTTTATGTPPRKPPRTFTHSTPIKSPKQKNSLFKLFTKTEKDVEPKKSNLRRSISDASNLKSKTFEKPNRKRSGSESEDNPNNTATKKTQLSPIIEVSTPRDDYFSQKKDYFSNKENLDDFVQEKNEINLSSKPPRKKWNKSNVSEFTKKGSLNEKTNKDAPEIVIIDVEKAESISDNKKKKLNSNSFKNKFKSLLHKKDTSKTEEKKKPIKEENIIPNDSIDEVDNILEDLKIETDIIHPPEAKTSPKIQETIKILEESLEKPTDMIHSSQKPAEKIPLTRGHTVDTMIKRLSRDKYSPPPKTNTILVTPTVTVAHNNNQPFSYIQPRGMSPERYSRSKSPERPYSRSKSPERPYSRARSPLFEKPSSPIIYAQVVCGNGDSDGLGSNKKTIHTAYANNKSKFQHSDSDEGLGYEENTALNRKYTQFGDEKKYDVEKYIEKYDEEYPITPKFKSFGSNGYDNYEYSKTEHHTSFVDSSVRGRGDGMDSRRRESLTEPLIENGISNKYNDHNGKSDLSYRRDLLESRINSRRLGDKVITNNSPELYTPRVNKYVSETTSRYYRHGSSSPVGFTDNYRSEMKTDRHGEKFITESRSRIVENDRNGRNLDYNNRYDRFESEPKSLESHGSDYRSSPENGSTNRKYFTSHETKEYRTHSKYKPKLEKLSKDRDHYKSNPEIINRNYDSYKYDQDRYPSETYHDSLKRQKHESRSREDLKHSEKYFDDRDRKDKFGDSGIENDFRRDSGENVRVTRTYTQTYRSNNESEDEGFASSLLIASERQHTEDNFNKKFKNYDSDKELRRNDIKKSKHDYVHRERSIDDGSHYDPRIDKDLDNKRGSLKMEKKPPKPAKMSSLKKVKQLFTRDPSKKKKDKVEMVKEETLRARYKEYRGSNEAVNRSTLKRDNHADYKRDYNSDSRVDNNSDNSQGYDYSNRRRLSTPSPSPTRETAHNVQSGKQNDGWFKSLDRFSLKKNKATKLAPSKENLKETSPKPAPTPQTKNLRFFGDTDLESDTSVRRKSSLKSRPNIPNNYKTPPASKTRSQSSRNLHNISEEFNNSDTDTLRKYKSHKSMQNISESDRDIKGSKSNLKPPISPNRRTDTLKKNTDTRNRKRRNEMSSVESSTEGDSSQQSQRSVVYLHAATVGDIPGPGYLARNGRRAASKEDLISNGSSRMQTQVKTLSRSFSVLAPWKPRYAHEGIEVDYSQQNRPARNMRNGSSKSGGKTAKEISNQKKMSNQNLSTLNRKSKSKENISNTLNRRNKDDISTKSSNTTLYKKKERLPKDNMRYARDEKKMSNKSMSVESLGGASRSSVRSKEDPRNISRSISMPRDPEKSAGWFNKINKKSNSKKTLSSQRL